MLLILNDPWTLVAVALAAVILIFGWIFGHINRGPLKQFIRQLRVAEASAMTSPVSSNDEFVDDAESIENNADGVDAEPDHVTIRKRSVAVKSKDVVAEAVQHWVAQCTAPDGSLYRSKSAATQFDDSLLERGVPTLRWLEVTPNMFVGVGLALTFALLAIAISLAGGAPAGDDSQALAMQRLLSTAGVKFITSIAAILVSLVLIWDRTRLYAQADRAMQSLVARLDELIPHREPEKLTDLFDAVHRQSDAMQQVADRIGKAEAEREASITRALSTAMAPMAKAIMDMGTTVATTNSETMERMVKEFTRELGAATARHNADLAEILKATNEALRTVPAEISKSSEVLGTTLADARDGLESLLKIGGIAMQQTTDQLEKLAKAVSDVDLRLADRIDIVEGDAKAASQQLRELSHLITGTTPAMTKAVEVAISATGKIEAVRAASEKAQSQIDTNVTAWVKGMELIDGRISGILKVLNQKRPPDDTANPSPDQEQR